MSGSLDEEGFRVSCQLLLQRSEQLSDGWFWEEVQGSEEGYLRKTTLRSVSVDGCWSDSETSCPSGRERRGQETQQAAAASVGEEDEEDDDEGVCTVTHSSSRVLQYEYHILFSCSHSTPVLYFRATTLEGRSLTLEEVWKAVHPNFRLRLQHSPLNTITQQEHPLLGQPFFMLHPCRTEEFMRPVLQAGQNQNRPVNYVLSWLSVVGPVVGLDVPLQYSTQLHPAASPSGSDPD
ncbi:ubiquitin-like-conjugating enzyme ATG10 [Embiotoca jacksoni]|uniref:ubiquitin-like-conjugating enzyme ATG10 n=1 Tax=Embiotoca jacksoni TaxID=100190 RepID=UPI003704C2F0